ncbi:hypothetical protein [Kribbella lupini]|uniref:hypothetical protein n=1 Tax=Kribbella lupini TaxID=291602 RepID=UPI0031E2F68A
MTRQFPPATADEREMLTGWLDRQRATVRLKCTGLSEEQAELAVLPASPRMTVKPWWGTSGMSNWGGSRPASSVSKL